MFDQEIAWLLEEKYNGLKTLSFFDDIARLEAGEPLAYIIGSIPFLSATIHLDSKPLIPRVETEFLVEKVIAEISKSKKPTSELRVLDLCAGSGCIGVAIAKIFRDIKIDFIEIDKSHIGTIDKNCLGNNINPDLYRIFQGNLFSISTDEDLPKYDYIVSNPPYIDPILNRAEVSVKKFEPALALYGGIKGLEIIKKIIEESPVHLNINGQLWLEHEPEHTLEINKLSSHRFITTTCNDQYKLERFTKLVLQ